ncbi:MAG TPA: hypothetical protein VE986_09345 [Hyphomicrobiales bacterium]|nr:hypothetical protein [Hyphomicrobiales bacterium]
MRSLFILHSGPVLLLSFLTLISFSAEAAPLDKNACARLAQDLQNMKAIEVDKLMEKGPAWAASHLSATDLNLIRQYIDLDEQMKFRCSAPSSLVHLKHLDDDDEDGAQKPAAAESSGSESKKAEGAAASPQSKQKNASVPKRTKQTAQPGSSDAR